MQNKAAIERFWQEFLQTIPIDAINKPAEYDAWSFGHTPELGDRLGALVKAGIKTATCSLAWSYAAEDEAMPRAGSYSIILDGQNQPLCIIQNQALETLPFNKVPAEHGHAEGEGDRSLAYWRKTHWEVYCMECKEHGFIPSEEMPVLCERFRLVYPLS